MKFLAYMLKTGLGTNNYRDLKQPSLYSFLLIICVAGNLFKLMEREKSCVNLYVFLLVEMLIGEYKCRMFYLLYLL